MGPYNEFIVCHIKYVLTLVKDHKRTIWTYLLQIKDEVFDFVAGFIKMIDTHFQMKILYFRSDHGTEFLNKRMAQLFHDHGILHQLSCVYTPQQNGIVECRHRMLLNTARALMFQSGLPMRFW